MSKHLLPGAIAFTLLGITDAHGAEAYLPLPAAAAVRAAKAALESCEAAGNHVTVTVVSPEGLIRVLMVGDGANFLSINTSRRKALTAVSLGVSTAALQGQPSSAGLSQVDPELIAFAGGLPIRHGGTIVAAIGVGGADQPAKDEACAKAGLAAINDYLTK